MESTSVMGQLEALELVEQHLTRGISNFRGSRNYYRRRSLLQTIATATLSAVTTLLIALNELYSRSYLVAISLVTAGLATVTASWSGWLGPRRLWLSNNQALVGLYEVRDQIDYDKALHGDDLTAEQITRYHEHIQTIFRHANDRWDKARAVGLD